MDGAADQQAQVCRAQLGEAHDAWLRGDGAGTWKALDAAERAATSAAEAPGLLAEVAGARSTALLRAERTTEALGAARQCLQLAGAPPHDDVALRLAVAHARVTIATYDPPHDGSGTAPPAALAVLDEIAAAGDPELEAARSRAITNGLNRRLVAAHHHLDDPEAQTAAWIHVSRARTLSEQLRAQGTVVRQAIDLANRTGHWERGWDYANLPLPGLERNEEVSLLAKAAQLAWHRGLRAEARELGTRARQASVAIDHPWVRVYAYLGGVIAAAAGAGAVTAALEAYRRCTTAAGHDIRSHRAWEAAQIALDSGLSAVQARSFLDATVPGEWSARRWAPFARAILDDATTGTPRAEDLAAIDLSEHSAVDQARIHLIHARSAATRGHRVSAVLSLQRARLLLRSWPGLVAGQVERAAAEIAAPFPLTAAQRRVLDLLIEGHTNREIGLALGCAERTAAVHVAALLRASGASSRAALAAQEVARRALQA